MSACREPERPADPPECMPWCQCNACANRKSDEERYAVRQASDLLYKLGELAEHEDFDGIAATCRTWLSGSLFLSPRLDHRIARAVLREVEK
jgi:hypothetical protein